MEEFRIRGARVDFRTYLKIVLILGFCMGLLFAAINLGINFFQLAMGDPDVGVGDLLLGLTVIVTGPLGIVLAAILAFPIYQYVTNRWFAITWKVFGERDH